MNAASARGWWLPLGIVLGAAAGMRLLFLPLLAALLCFRPACRKWRLPLLLTAAGILLGGGAALISGWRQERLERFFPTNGARRMELRLVWNDPALGLGPEQCPEAPKPGAYQWVRKARILAVREPDVADAPWQPFDGGVMVRFAPAALPEIPAMVTNGGQLEAEGVWNPPDNDAVNETESFRLLPDGTSEAVPPPGGSGWREYLAARGLAGSFEIRQWQALPPVRNWQTRCFAWRDRMMTRVLNALPDPESRAMTAAMVFGCRGGLAPQFKQNFIRSGVIHLFTVSGLHVGILAGLLFWLFRWVPFRYRAWMLPVLALYVMMTGAEAPAVRAFLMVLALALVRSELCWINGVQLLLWIAAALLLIHPAQIHDAGFQYTFLVTGFLLLAQTRMRELSRAAGAVDQLLPGRLKTRRSRLILNWKIRPVQAFAMAGIAFAAAGSLSLFHQGNFFPGSVLLNVALLPVLSLNFLFAALALLSPGGGGGLLAWSLALMNHLVRWGSEAASGHGYLQPSGWSVALFLAVLALWLAAPNRKAAVAALLFLVAWLGWRIVGPHFQPPVILVANGGFGGPVPTVLFCRPAEGCMTVLDPAGRNRWIKQSADRFGIGRIETVILTRPVLGACSNLERLPLLLPVAEIAVAETPPKIRSRVLPDVLKSLHLPVRYGESGTWRNGAFALSGSKGRYAFQEAGFPARRLTLTMQPDGVTCWEAGGPCVRQTRSFRPRAVEQFWEEPE